MEEFIKYRPRFDAGVILKAEKMNELVEHAFNLPDLVYRGYTKGIISGLDITIDGDFIVISKGLFLYEEEVYTLNKDIRISYHPTNNWNYLKICKKESMKKIDGIQTHFVVISDDLLTKESELELCRFKLQEGAKLRYIYDDFEDMNTEFDTVNLIYSPYSSKEMAGLHPKILKNFAKEMLDLRPQNPLDTFFCMQVLGLNTTMNIEEIIRYIEIKKEENLGKVTNYTIYHHLLDILKKEKANSKGVKKKATPQRKILID